MRTGRLTNAELAATQATLGYRLEVAIDDPKGDGARRALETALAAADVVRTRAELFGVPADVDGRALLASIGELGRAGRDLLGASNDEELARRLESARNVHRMNVSDLAAFQSARAEPAWQRRSRGSAGRER